VSVGVVGAAGAAGAVVVVAAAVGLAWWTGLFGARRSTRRSGRAYVHVSAAYEPGGGAGNDDDELIGTATIVTAAFVRHDADNGERDGIGDEDVELTGTATFIRHDARRGNNDNDNDDELMVFA
jgi:hypothetical protein